MAVVTWSGLLLAVVGLYWSLRLREPLAAREVVRTGHRIGAAALAVAGFLCLIITGTIDAGPRSSSLREDTRSTDLTADIPSLPTIKPPAARPETRGPTVGSDAVLFWCGTVLTLASAVWLLQTASPFESHASVTIFLIGAAMLFASAQATELLLAMLAAATIPGWLASRATNASSPDASAGSSETNHRECHTSPSLARVREPLLKSVLAASLCWLIAPAIHNSATREVRPAASGHAAGGLAASDDTSQRRMPAPRIQPTGRIQSDSGNPPATTRGADTRDSTAHRILLPLAITLIAAAPLLIRRQSADSVTVLRRPMKNGQGRPGSSG